MPNSWSKWAYVQGFECEYINFKKVVNMFKRMEIAESIYEGVVEPSYKNIPRKTPIVLFTEGKREEKPTSHVIYPRSVKALLGAENNM